MLFNNELEIPQENPFENDVLQRAENIEILTNLINMTDQPMVLAINSEWGTGKTTFVKMWQQHLKNNGYSTLYFNAWENDFVEEPFIAFVNEFEGIIGDDNKFKRIVDIGKEVLKGLLPAAIKIATSGILDLEKVKLGDNTEGAISSCFEKIADEQIEKYRATKNAMIKFKEVLSTYISQKSEESGKPIVFFVDELDRCRPNYAIELLEKVKHLFYLNGIIFVLSIDKEQVGHSIRSIYGQNMNVEGYLARFIDVEYKLPSFEEENYVKHLFSKLNVRSFFIKRQIDNEYDSCLSLCSGMQKCFNFTLRQQEKIISRFVITIKTFGERDYLLFDLLYFLLCLRNYSFSLYQRILNKTITFTDLMKESVIKSLVEMEDVGPYYEAEFLWMIGNESEIQRYLNDYKSFMVHDAQSERTYRLGIITKVYSDYFNKRISNPIPYLVKKVEIYDSFKS